MAGFPPPGVGAGVLPPRPPTLTPVPGIPPQMPPQAPPVPTPPPGGGAANPLMGALADLPSSLPPGWQAVDMSVRCIRTALRAVEMQKAPDVVAVLSSTANTLSRLISAYTEGTSSGSSVPETSSAGNTEASPSADADSQPAASVEASESSSGDTES